MLHCTYLFLLFFLFVGYCFQVEVIKVDTFHKVTALELSCVEQHVVVEVYVCYNGCGNIQFFANLLQKGNKILLVTDVFVFKNDISGNFFFPNSCSPNFHSGFLLALIVVLYQIAAFLQTNFANLLQIV